ncbi:hypothetical protein O181_028396 [Austropuccinia psidii MF-1]|uniref:Reverse transcriptase Ty1/copia-type domain-containing protein n=1 Tax=Austropuccinia psidii MF-1 TaxID=1389203 RepID=A0A9Q3H2C2_9BASI|nr:hypothetical protein [Austropuccinia psidii MF-1]
MRWSLPWTPKEIEVTGKMDIAFVLNSLSLGEITTESTLELQDKIAAELQAASLNIVTPKTYKQAITSPENSDWEDAICSELCNMRDVGVYDILPIPRGRMVLMICGARKWYVNSFDFVAAYLNAKIDTAIWVRPPNGLHIPNGFGCKLCKALYGTKQAGYFWWQCVATRLTTLGYAASDFDKSLYLHESQKAMIWLHVDDGIIAAEDERLLLQLCDELGKSFKLKWEDSVNSIVGIDIMRTNGGYKLRQQRLIESIFQTTWDSTLSIKTPLPAKCNLVTLRDNEEVTHAKDYIGAVGALSYVTMGT